MPDTTKWLFAPDGGAITDVIIECITARDICVDSNTGEVEDDWSGDDLTPSGSVLRTADRRATFVQDRGMVEYLDRHCRVVDCYDGFWPDSETVYIEAWPVDIVEKCARVAALEACLVSTTQLRALAPKGLLDTTIDAALGNLIEGRIKAEIETLEAAIAAFRVGRAEPTVLEEIEETEEDGDG